MCSSRVQAARTRLCDCARVLAAAAAVATAAVAAAAAEAMAVCPAVSPAVGLLCPMRPPAAKSDCSKSMRAPSFNSTQLGPAPRSRHDEIKFTFPR